MPHKHCSRSPSASESDTSSDSSISSMEHLQPCLKKLSKKHGHKSDKGDREVKQAKISKENNSELEAQEDYLVAAHAMARCTDLFCNMEKLLRVGLLLQQEQAAENGELEESEVEHESRQKRLAIRPIPSISTSATISSCSKELTQITQKMTAVISGTRLDDATHLKAQISHYAVPEPLKEGLKPTIYNGGSLSRVHMGINHPVLASFLCLISALTDFNRDPTLAQKWMEIRRICMTSIDFPVFLWAGNPPGSRYNKDAMHEGLFQGYLIEHIMCHIFTGPSTALGDDSCTTHLCNMSLHDMTTVEAEHIAYVCIQARFAISNKNKWSEADSQFNNRAF
ncbi:uncharacterized protein F5891DRAFT_1180509 [Suillus fuscotomentosus]|uniref:Uncharacterized protein n=1 Tax=Suillus fuscotomentosus TaxID=1912939 RepID=A0AAD4HWV0_9AGAM|nr:uncharacterized protein F5891DRAFT_1180509 [Suillus fuscotomentosus]KAG1908939.1 hypothetical protein F5891DRAFT_1180509 [Suillus fuscotomentosus]